MYDEYDDFYDDRKPRKDTWKWIIAFILIAALAVSLVVTVMRFENSVTTETISARFGYEIGSLDEVGQFRKNTASIVTKDFHSTSGLKFEFAEDAQVDVVLYYYDASGNFLSSLKVDEATASQLAVPVNAKLFKVMMTPQNDAEVSFFEINDVAEQVTVTIAR